MKFVHTADTHLGFEITKRSQCHPQSRKRRADSIFENFLTVIKHAIDNEADLFIHSGDLFNKYYIPREILDRLIQPIFDLAHTGIPVLIIPGNHERSQFPFDLFHGSSKIFVFDRPKSLSLDLDGYAVGIAGFPFIRVNSKRTFLYALNETGYEDLRTDLKLLVTHQAFDGATVGPVDFTFRPVRSDTVLRRTIPLDFDYIAAGHIHRYQVLPHPLNPSVPFVYPGSTQRMSFAEMYEEKGFVEGELLNGRIETRFLPLPAHDMEIVEVEAVGKTSHDCEADIRSQFWRLRNDLVIRFNLTGGTRKGDYPDIDFDRIRAEMPAVLECHFAIKAGKRWILK